LLFHEEEKEEVVVGWWWGWNIWSLMDVGMQVFLFFQD
jgi:hypothetical protein